MICRSWWAGERSTEKN